MNLIQLKFGMCITGHHWMNPIDFGECWMHSFFTGIQKRFLKHYGLWSRNSLKDASIQTMHLIELKLGMYIIGRHTTNATDFGGFLMHTGVQKRILTQYGLRSQIL